MGHTRLGSIPKSRKWKDVVSAVGASPDGVAPDLPDVREVASRTLEAAERGLSAALDDDGFHYCVFLLTQAALASRQEDWLERIRDLGIEITDSPSPFDFAVGFQQAIDSYVTRHQVPSDISETAQRAAGEVLVQVLTPVSSALFGDDAEILQRAIRQQISTKTGFARLAQAFFGRFIARFLNFYLSRVSATELGRGSLHQVGDISKFNDLLERHCHETAQIVADFAGEWYSKTEYLTGIDLDNTKRFAAVCVQKLQAELTREREGT